MLCKNVRILIMEFEYLFIFQKIHIKPNKNKPEKEIYYLFSIVEPYFPLLKKQFLKIEGILLYFGSMWHHTRNSKQYLPFDTLV